MVEHEAPVIALRGDGRCGGWTRKRRPYENDAALRRDMALASLALSALPRMADIGFDLDTRVANRGSVLRNDGRIGGLARKLRLYTVIAAFLRGTV